MLENVDLLICGAGPVGCTIAERASRVLGWNVLIVDRRLHVAGNCFDTHHHTGVLIHRYGPHYFRTNDLSLVDYLSQFTDWSAANYVVKSQVAGQLYPFPINLTTLEKFFKKKLTPESAERLLESKRQAIAQPKNSEEFVLNRVGRELYEAFYLNYTQKQWLLHPSQLAQSVCGRIPIRLNRDDRYVDHRFQKMPANGFTAMFERMIDHPNIRVLLGCDFHRISEVVKPRMATVYSGPIDAFFDNRFGKLPYRSLQFEFVPYRQEFRQPCVQINYPNEHDYTRTVEIKHVTRQSHPHTVLSYEYPRTTGDPYYPVHTPENLQLYQRYEALAENLTRTQHVYFCGRLAQYRYFNTDEVITEALQCFERIRNRYAPNVEPSALSSPATALT